MTAFPETMIADRAQRALGSVLARGAAVYVRARHLSALLGSGPDLTESGPAATLRILRRLARLLRAERARGRAGHWTYDLNRHIALRQAFEAERAALRRERLASAAPGTAGVGPSRGRAAGEAGSGGAPCARPSQPAP